MVGWGIGDWSLIAESRTGLDDYGYPDGTGSLLSWMSLWINTLHMIAFYHDHEDGMKYTHII